MLDEINTLLKRIYSENFLSHEILIKISQVCFRISTESSLQGNWTAAVMIKSNKELWLP